MLVRQALVKARLPTQVVCVSDVFGGGCGCGFNGCDKIGTVIKVLFGDCSCFREVLVWFVGGDAVYRVGEAVSVVIVCVC